MGAPAFHDRAATVKQHLAARGPTRRILARQLPASANGSDHGPCGVDAARWLRSWSA
jgi:hypothetical protein